MRLLGTAIVMLCCVASTLLYNEVLPVYTAVWTTFALGAALIGGWVLIIND